MNDQPVYRPRRRRQSWIWAVPTWRKITFVLVTIGLLTLCGIKIADQVRAGEGPPAVAAVPTPEPTWTTFITQTPAACYAAMDAADEVFQASLKSDSATLEAVRLASRSEYSAVPAAIKKAQAAGEALHDARENYLKKAKACRT